MSSMAKAEIIGRLTRDPELKQTKNGKSVCNISLAVNRFGNDEGVDFYDITIWNDRAEKVASHKAKGDLVYVQGRLQTDKWEKDGVQRTKTFIVASDVLYLPRGGSDNGSAANTATDDSDDIPF